MIVAEPVPLRQCMARPEVAPRAGKLTTSPASHEAAWKQFKSAATICRIAAN
jgi:hypothetical protein